MSRGFCARLTIYHYCRTRKKLAAISRQAKERKAKERKAEREAAIRKEESDRENSNAPYTLFAIIPVILFGGYYLYFRKPKNENIEDGEPEKQKPNLEKL